jgi:hypothetical protein
MTATPLEVEATRAKLKLIEDDLRSLGRRGWEARRREVLTEAAQLDAYPRLSNAQAQRAEDLATEQVVLDGLIGQDDLARESSFRRSSVPVRQGRRMPPRPGRSRRSWRVPGVRGRCSVATRGRSRRLVMRRWCVRRR